MKIILWAPFGAGTHYWGPGTSAYRLYRLNKNPDIKVTLVHGTDRQGDFPDVYDEQVQLGNLEGAGIFKKLMFLISSFLWIVKNHKKYDILHGLGPFWDTFFPALLFTQLGGKSFIKITGQTAGFSNNSRLSRLTGISYLRRKNATKITGYLSLSKQITSLLQKAGIQHETIHKIPNGVDIQRFYPISRPDKLIIRTDLNIKNVYTFMYCGGLTYGKRIVETIQAAHHLIVNDVRDFQLLVVGPDRSKQNLQAKLEEYIKDNNLQDHVILVGSTNTPELYFQASDAFILASKSEGMSNSLLEAMACGLPSIVTKISGSEDLIDEGVHGLFTSGEPEDIARCMLTLYSDVNAHNMGAKAKEKIDREYAAEVIWTKHLKLFKNQ